MKVFVSSTCYDLVDVRAEVEAHLRDLGLTPVMSDRPSSEFKVVPDVNSIETCLVNVREADVFVCILNQRYGPSLGTAGFDDVSATHLEWLEAKRTRRHIYMYVRDRTEAEAGLRRRNPGLRTNWVGDEKLFSLLEQHRSLTADASSSNWLWTFRDSLELKARLAEDLRAYSSSGMMRKWLEQGKLPLLSASGSVPGTTPFHGYPCLLSCVNDTPVHDVEVSDDGGGDWHPIGVITPGHAVPFTIRAPDTFLPLPPELPLLIRYRTHFGTLLQDTFKVEPLSPGAALRIRLIEKKLVEAVAFNLA